MQGYLLALQLFFIGGDLNLVYRIDLKHYLTHAIDYFTVEELVHMQYAIVSAHILNTGKAINMAKINNLYPEPEIVMNYEEYKDKDIMEKMYFGYLDPDEEDKAKLKRGESYFIYNIIYKTFINPLLQHKDIVIICEEGENDYIDVLCKYLKKRFDIEVIDLNELFKTGHVGPIYIDRKEIKDKSVDIARSCGKDQIHSLASSSDGRAKLISMMSKKEKIKKLKKFGIDPTDEDKKNLDALLLNTWNEEIEDNEK